MTHNDRDYYHHDANQHRRALARYLIVRPSVRRDAPDTNPLNQQMLLRSPLLQRTTNALVNYSDWLSYTSIRTTSRWNVRVAPG